MPFEVQTGVVDKLLYACEVAEFNEEKRIQYDNENEMARERAEGKAEGRAGNQSTRMSLTQRVVLALALVFRVIIPSAKLYPYFVTVLRPKTPNEKAVRHII